jgi:hypothetical protein
MPVVILTNQKRDSEVQIQSFLVTSSTCAPISFLGRCTSTSSSTQLTNIDRSRPSQFTFMSTSASFFASNTMSQLDSNRSAANKQETPCDVKLYLKDFPGNKGSKAQGKTVDVLMDSAFTGPWTPKGHDFRCWEGKPIGVYVDSVHAAEAKLTEIRYKFKEAGYKITPVFSYLDESGVHVGWQLYNPLTLHGNFFWIEKNCRYEG